MKVAYFMLPLELLRLSRLPLLLLDYPLPVDLNLLALVTLIQGRHWFLDVFPWPFLQFHLTDFR